MRSFAAAAPPVLMIFVVGKAGVQRVGALPAVRGGRPQRRRPTLADDGRRVQGQDAPGAGNLVEGLHQPGQLAGVHGLHVAPEAGQHGRVLGVLALDHRAVGREAGQVGVQVAAQELHGRIVLRDGGHRAATVLVAGRDDGGQGVEAARQAHDRADAGRGGQGFPVAHAVDQGQGRVEPLLALGRHGRR